MEIEQSKIKSTLLLLDIMMVIAILSNAGAYIITNAMVTKSVPNIQIYEANPAAYTFNVDLTPPKEAKKQLFSKFITHIGHSVLLGFILGVYIFLRKRCNNLAKLAAMTFGVSIWFTMLFLNFANDFGFWLGTIL